MKAKNRKFLENYLNIYTVYLGKFFRPSKFNLKIRPFILRKKVSFFEAKKTAMEKSESEIKKF